MTELTDLATDWGEWLLLHRADQGAVTKRDGSYLIAGQPITGYLATVLDALLKGELLTLNTPDTPDAPDSPNAQRLKLTDTGKARYTTLRHSQPNGTVTTKPEPPHPPDHPRPS